MPHPLRRAVTPAAVLLAAASLATAPGAPASAASPHDRAAAPAALLARAGGTRLAAASVAPGHTVAGVSVAAFAAGPRALAAARHRADLDSVSSAGTASGARATTTRASRSTTRVARSPQQIGKSLASARGWGGRQFACLDALWTKESNWTATADNPTSSAYGIPQALPGRKMASHGADWRTNPETQIRWGLDYIAEVYGSPCKAWSHSRRLNWY